MATNRGNEERFERISYSGYKMSSDKDIAQFLNERDSLQDDRDAAMLLGDFFAVSEFLNTMFSCHYRDYD